MRKTIAEANPKNNSTRQLVNCYRKQDTFPMSTPETRLEKLKQLIDKHKSVAEFARQHDLDVTYLRQLLNGHRTFGEKSARKMGEKIAGNPMLFDTTPQEGANIAENSVPYASDLSPKQRAMLNLMKELTEKQQDELIRRAEERVEENMEVVTQLTRPARNRSQN